MPSDSAVGLCMQVERILPETKMNIVSGWCVKIERKKRKTKGGRERGEKGERKGRELHTSRSFLYCGLSFSNLYSSVCPNIIVSSMGAILIISINFCD